MSHKLHTKWKVYFHQRMPPNNFDGGICELVSVNTIEDFWKMWNQFHPIFLSLFDEHSCMKFQSREVITISMFRRDITPKWEHPSNVNGSEWCCRVTPREASIGEIENTFQNLIFACIGEQLDTSPLPHVVGIRFVNKTSKKNGQVFKIEIWMASTQEKKTQQTLNCIRNIVKNESFLFEMVEHKTSTKNNYSFIHAAS